MAYPLVMAQQYFLTHRGVDQAIIADAKKKLQSSYDRLKSFEVKTAFIIPSGGFGTCSSVLGNYFTHVGTPPLDWYGSAPANESLTAYGLHEFQDMKKVYPVEDALIARIKSARLPFLLFIFVVVFFLSLSTLHPVSCSRFLSI